MNALRITFLAILWVLISACQNSGQAVPKAVLKSFSKKYPEISKVKWEIDKNGFYEAKFKLDEESLRADFHKSGRWIETETNIKYKDLPKVVRKIIERDYPTFPIEEIEKVWHHEKVFFYDVEFNPKKGAKFDIEYSATGERLN